MVILLVICTILALLCNSTAARSSNNSKIWSIFKNINTGIETYNTIYRITASND